jgi:hypothetical protein
VLLPLESLIRSPREVGDLPSATAGVAGTAALASARLVSAGGGQAVFAGQASDGDPLTVQAAAVADGVIRVSLSRTGAERPRSEPALPLVQPVPFGRSRLPDGTHRYHLSFAAGPDEQFYGLGERFGTLGRRGSRTVAWIEDALGVNGPRAYKAVPATCRCRRAGRSAPGCRHRSPPPRVRCGLTR